MKYALRVLVCLTLCLSVTATGAADGLTMDDVTEIITIDQLTPEQREELLPWFMQMPTETPEATETPTAGTRPLPSAAPDVPKLTFNPTATPSPTPTPTPTPTPKPTSTPIPPHSFALDFLYCDFWYNNDGFCRAKWKNDGDNELFAVIVENKTEDYVIDAIDFIVYGTNAYGETIYIDSMYSPYCYYSLDLSLKPGKHKYTQYMRLDDLGHANTINIAITRYHIKDMFTVYCNDPAYSDPIKEYRWYSWDIN